MAITSILRDWSGIPQIVRIDSSDNLATISAPGYLTAQAANIYAANNGAFNWLATDFILVVYNNTLGNIAWQFFGISGDFSSLLPYSSGFTPLNTITLTAAEVLAAYATPQLLIPAPGVGNAIFITTAQIVTTVSTAFAGGGVGNVQYGATAHGAGYDALDAKTPAAEITAATSQIYTQYGIPTTTVSTFADVENLGIYWSNATNAFTGGAGSTVAFTLQYFIMSGV